MKKVVINLSPQKHKYSKLNLTNLSSYLPLVSLAAVIGLILVLLLHLVVLRKAYIYAAKTKDWKQWEDKAKALSEVKAQINESKTRYDQLNRILTPNYQLSSLLEDIFSSLPKNIWFQSLNFREDSLGIDGYVVRWSQDYLASLDSFIKSLREKEYFSSKFASLQIRESQKANFNGVEVLKFIIECKK